MTAHRTLILDHPDPALIAESREALRTLHLAGPESSPLDTLWVEASTPWNIRSHINGHISRRQFGPDFNYSRMTVADALDAFALIVSRPVAYVKHDGTWREVKGQVTELWAPILDRVYRPGPNRDEAARLVSLSASYGRGHFYSAQMAQGIPLRSFQIGDYNPQKIAHIRAIHRLEV